MSWSVRPATTYHRVVVGYRNARPWLLAVAAYGSAGCLVSFNDYPTGDLSVHRGGSSQGMAGSVGAGGPASGGSGGSSGAATSGGTSSDGCAELEVCDGLDNDCNDLADDGDVCPGGCKGVSAFGHVYMFCTTPLAAEAAASVCSEHDMTLVQVDDLEESDWVHTTMAAEQVTGPYILTGGSDAAEEGRWVWPDGTQFWDGGAYGQAVNNAFTHWTDGEPDNSSQYNQPEACAVIRLVDTPGYWSDTDCEREMVFACEAN